MVWIRITSLRIRIRLNTLIDPEPDSDFLFDADPDPTFHPKAYPDPGPSFKKG